MGEKRPDQGEQEINLLELTMELVTRWKRIVILVILAAGIGFGVSKFLLETRYQSTSLLYVFTKSTSITSLADLQTGANLTNDYKVVITGRPVLEQVIENLKLSDTYRSLQERISVTNPQDSRILEITVTDQSPKQAKAIADELADLSAGFISDKMGQDAPSVIQYGYADENPAAPNIKKNTLLAGALGLFLAVISIVLPFIFYDAILTEEDVQKKLGLQVLGVLPEEDVEGDRKRKYRKR